MNYPDKTFENLEIELSDPTDDDISVSKNSYCANPNPPRTSNILVASTSRKDKMQAFQSTLAAKYPASAKHTSQLNSPTQGYTTAAEIYNGYNATFNLSQLATKIDASTDKVLNAISAFRSFYVDTQTVAVDSALNADQPHLSPRPDTAAITAAHNEPASLSQEQDVNKFDYSEAETDMDQSYSGSLRNQGDAILASLDSAAADISPIGKSATDASNRHPRTTEELKQSINQLRDSSLSWDEQGEEETQTNTEKTQTTRTVQSVKVSILSPSAQTESKQPALSSRQAEVKQPDHSPPEEHLDPVQQHHDTLDSPPQFYPSGRPKRKTHKTLTQSDDEADN
jgi:hypothetical protein